MHAKHAMHPICATLNAICATLKTKTWQHSNLSRAPPLLCKPAAHLQMDVAAAMVSQLLRLRTRLLSASMRCTLKASASVTASGRPSGTATTSSVMLVMKNARYAWTAAARSSSRQQQQQQVNGTDGANKGSVKTAAQA
jgi:hypothetical protein